MEHMIFFFLKKPVFLMWTAVHLVFAYLTIHYFLHCLKSPIKIGYSAFVLLALSMLTMLTCPIMNTIFMYCAKQVEIAKMML